MTSGKRLVKSRFARVPVAEASSRMNTLARALGVKIFEKLASASDREQLREVLLPLVGEGCRFSLFFRKAVHANAQLFCSLGPQDRENRQPPEPGGLFSDSWSAASFAALSLSIASSATL